MTAYAREPISCEELLFNYFYGINVYQDEDCEFQPGSVLGIYKSVGPAYLPIYLVSETDRGHVPIVIKDTTAPYYCLIALEIGGFLAFPLLGRSVKRHVQEYAGKEIIGVNVFGDRRRGYELKCNPVVVDLVCRSLEFSQVGQGTMNYTPRDTFILAGKLELAFLSETT